MCVVSLARFTHFVRNHQVDPLCIISPHPPGLQLDVPQPYDSLSGREANTMNMSAMQHSSPRQKHRGSHDCTVKTAFPCLEGDAGPAPTSGFSRREGDSAPAPAFASREINGRLCGAKVSLHYPSDTLSVTGPSFQPTHSRGNYVYFNISYPLIEFCTAPLRDLFIQGCRRWWIWALVSVRDF